MPDDLEEKGIQERVTSGFPWLWRSWWEVKVKDNRQFNMATGNRQFNMATGYRQFIMATGYRQFNTYWGLPEKQNQLGIQRYISGDLLWELAYVLLQAEMFHDLLSTSWRSMKAHSDQSPRVQKQNKTKNTKHPNPQWLHLPCSVLVCAHLVTAGHFYSVQDSNANFFQECP